MEQALTQQANTSNAKCRNQNSMGAKRLLNNASVVSGSQASRCREL